MAKPHHAVHDLKSLDEAIQHLGEEASQLEEKLDERISYLQGNYSSLLLKSIFPASQAVNHLPLGLIPLALQNQRLKDSVSRLTNQLVERVADGLDFVSSKIEKRSH